MTKRDLVLLTWLVAGVCSPALAQKVGPEFQVNTYTTDFQGFPDVASDPAGNFVVVWASREQDGDDDGVFGQRYDSAGNQVGSEFQINTYTTKDQREASVASDAAGNFVVVWQSRQHGSFAGIFGQRYDSEGNALGAEFKVNTYTTDSPYYPEIASDASGNFVVVWEGLDQWGIFGQRFDSSGNRLGGEFQVNSYPHEYNDATVASDANGNFVVVWWGFGQDGNLGGVFGQRFDSSGNRLGGEFQVNSYTRGSQVHPAVSLHASGNFVVVWESNDYRWGIFGQRFDSNGDPVDGEFRVNTFTGGSEERPAVASDEFGDFVVVWDSFGPGWGVSGQRYDRSGNRLGREFQVNTYTASFFPSASVSSDPSGNFVVVWRRLHQDGRGEDVSGQRFSAGCKASVQVQGEVNTAGTLVPVQVHIAHGRPETVTVRWKLNLLDASGEVVAKHISSPHTFAPGDVLDQEVQFQLPDDLPSGEYTLDLAIKEMAGTRGAKTTLRVVRAE